ncbi:MAG: hypothetical protein ACK5I7_07695, partial [Anaerotignum sp.]
MKKKVALLALTVLFVSMGLGYFFSTKDQQMNTTPTQMELVQAAKSEVTLQKEGKVIYQYYYTKDA